MKRNGYRTMKACRGKYIAFCEGDDYWHHLDKLQKQVDYMERHPECGLAFGDYDVYYEKFDRLVRSYNYGIGFKSVTNLTIEQILEQRWRHSTCTAIVRRSLYEQVVERDPYLHQDEKFLLGDLQLWAELAAISTVSYIPESFGTYRILEESASRSKDAIKDARFWKSAFEVKLYVCDKYNLSDNIRREYELAWCDTSLRLALHSRNPQLAEEVRRKKRTFTWKDWIRYYGAKHMSFYYFYRLVALIRSSFRKGLRFTSCLIIPRPLKSRTPIAKAGDM
jgi:glycosyltransferase involved in cell wall biosynthesis